MKKRKLHLGITPMAICVGKSIKSRKKAREITSKYHLIRNQIAALKTAPSSSNNLSEVKSSLLAEIELLGGVDAYQQASIISTQYFNTSKWIAKTLFELLSEKSVVATTSHHKPKLLEVGAINPYLSKLDWLDTRAIDLHSQHPLIEQCDFFSVPPERAYDSVVCSMVINCIPSPEKRGEMLCRLAEHIHREGVLFLVLPLRFVHSTSEGGAAAFESLLAALGMALLREPRVTPKLVFYVLGKANIPQNGTGGDWLDRIVTMLGISKSLQVLKLFDGSKDVDLLLQGNRKDFKEMIGCRITIPSILLNRK